MSSPSSPSSTADHNRANGLTSSPARGCFIVLEGGEGAGKSTQVATVVNWLAQRGRQVVRTREPGGSPLAEAIRQIVLNDWAEGIPPIAELLLIFAARAAHWHTTIEPALAAGHDVVCDRFVDASFAYQGGGRQLGEAPVALLEQLVLANAKPDLVLLLDLEPEIGLQRARARGDENRFEAEALVFQQRVRQAYLRRAELAPERYAIIDASLAQSQVTTAIERTLSLAASRLNLSNQSVEVSASS